MDPRFTRDMPGALFLDPDAPDALRDHLRAIGWLGASEALTRVERAGEGNMNLVLRVWTDARSFIVKQSRPWVERYPAIDAPADRALVEARFYGLAAGAVAARMPRLLAVDAPSRMLLLEDLGPAADLTDAYGGRPIAADELDALIDWLGALHGTPPPMDGSLDNRGMRALNHLHMFDLPLRPDGGTDPERRGTWLRSDRAYVAVVRALGERYLAGGPCLVHGDYYPGSWVRTARGVHVLDPEFAHAGDAELDLGVMAAHLVFTGAGSPGALLARYPRPADATLVRRYAGVELMRRVLGVARLPLRADEERLRSWLELSRSWVLG
ncbi:MAG TPA: phosphotransferase [Myxococcota bacterium]|nr:phosphotransferase [Myxococcota bacterium]